MSNTNELLISMGIDTSGLDSSLKHINKATKNLEKAFSESNKALNLSEKSMNDFSNTLQSGKNLIGSYENRLKALNEEYDKGKIKLERYAKQQEQLPKDIQNAKTKLEELEKTLGKSSDEYQKQEQVVSSLEKKFDSLPSKISNTINSMERLENQMLETKNKIKLTENSIDYLSKSMDNIDGFDFGDLAEGFGEVKGKLGGVIGVIGNVSSAFINLGVDSVKWLGNIISNVTKLSAKMGALVVGLGGFSVKLAGDFQATKEMVNSTFGKNLDKAQQTMKKFSDKTGIYSGRVSEVFAKMYAQFKSAGADDTTALKNMERAMYVVADASAYFNISFEEAEQRVRSFMRMNLEAGDSINLSANEMARNKKSIELYGVEFKKLNEQQRQFTLLSIAEETYKQSGAFEQAIREASSLENVIGNLSYISQEFVATLGNSMLQPAIDSMKDFSIILSQTKEKIEKEGLQVGIEYMVNEIVKKLNSLSEHIPEVMSNVINGINSFITNSLPNILNLGTTIISNIGKGITENKQEIEKGLSSVISSLSNFIIDNAPTILEIGKTIITTIGTAIQENKDAIRGAIKSLVETASTLFLEYKGLIVESAITLGGAFIQGLWTGIWNSGQKYKGMHSNYMPNEEDAKTEGANYGKAWLLSSGEVIKGDMSFKDNIKAIFSGDTFTQIEVSGADSGYAFVNGLKVKIEEQSPEVKNVINDLLKSGGTETQKGIDAGTKLTEGVKQGIDNTSSNVVNAIDQATTNATQKAIDNTQNMKTVIENNLSGLGEITLTKTGEIPKVTKQNLDNSIQTIKDSATGLQDATRVAFTGIFNQAKNQFGNMTNVARTEFVNLANIIKNQSINLYTSSTTNFTSMCNVFRTQAVNMHNIARNQFVAIYNIGANQFKNLRDSITSQMISAYKVVSTQWGKIQDVVGNGANVKVKVTKSNNNNSKQGKIAPPPMTMPTSTITDSVNNMARINLDSMMYRASNYQPTELPTTYYGNGTSARYNNAETNNNNNNQDLKDMFYMLMGMMQQVISSDRHITANVNLDGRQIATASAKYMESEINNINKRKSRLGII